MKIKKHIESWVVDIITRTVLPIVHREVFELKHDLLAQIGVSDLARLVDRAEKNRERVGHNDYENLASVFREIVLEREIKISNEDIARRLSSIRRDILKNLE